MPTAERCVFCGASSLEHEHAFPNWIDRALPGGGGYRAERRSTSTTPGVLGVTSTWRQNGLPTVQIVCHPCNSGWMKRLEDRAAPILRPMIRGKHVYRGPDDQAIIARWACKTAAMCKYAASNDETRERLQWLRSHDEPPHDAEVWVASYTADEVGALFTVHRSAIQSAKIKVRRRHFDVVTMTIGHLVLQVLDVPAAGLKVDRGADHATYSTRLHPPQQQLLLWPPKFALGPASLHDFEDQLMQPQERPKRPGTDQRQ